MHIFVKTLTDADGQDHHPGRGGVGLEDPGQGEHPGRPRDGGLQQPEGQHAASGAAAARTLGQEPPREAKSFSAAAHDVPSHAELLASCFHEGKDGSWCVRQPCVVRSLAVMRNVTLFWLMCSAALAGRAGPTMGQRY